MVQFLLHNSLGAWWASRHPERACPADLTYLRHADDGQPAAGTFDGWPDDLAEFKFLDPCCGSGHFLVAALLMLVPMRMALEGLDTREAVDAVLRENLHGLEIDQRCVAIAAFALALEAWRYPEAGGYRKLPRLNLAWCGQPVAARKEEWLSFAEGDSKVEAGMAALHDAFRDAPTLGSLIDPVRSAPEDMLTAGFDRLRPLLERALDEHIGDAETEEAVIGALGAIKSAELLAGQFDLVATNVPFLSQIRFAPTLDAFLSRHLTESRGNLATGMVSRMKNLCTSGGMLAFVAPSSWTFLKRYVQFRTDLLQKTTFGVMARLGENAFLSTQAGGEFVTLTVLQKREPPDEHAFCAVDVQQYLTASGKAEALQNETLRLVPQRTQLLNPDATVTLDQLQSDTTLGEFCTALFGSSAGDRPRFVRKFYEVQVERRHVWRLHQTSPPSTVAFGGREEAILWEMEQGQMYELAKSVSHLNHKAQQWRSGKPNWGKAGVAVSLMVPFPATLYTGEIYDTNCCAIVPKSQSESEVAALWTYCSSGEFAQAIRRINQNRKVEVGTVLSIPFDQDAHLSRPPSALPKPYSNEPTEWIFHGHPCGSVVWDEAVTRTVEGPLRVDGTVLQVAVARLLGYRWPAEHDAEMVLAVEQRRWATRCVALHKLEDQDGIVCIPSVRGERPAYERLLDLIRESYADSWTEDILGRLLRGGRTTALDDWLRNRFFDEHCKLFQHRPFIWHVWDGRKRDGFHALVSYHRLAESSGAGRQLLESLAYSYLGDWIARQRDGVARGVAGSDERLGAALHLQRRLAAIIEGEPPFDIFVRWKRLGEQAIGWNPDLNDGVRLNIRPFLADDIPGGKKGAGVLRSKPNLHWRKDRGKEPSGVESEFPWFWRNGRFTGERVNDVHLTVAQRRSARRPTGAKG